MQSAGSMTLRLAPNLHGGWDIKEPGAVRPLHHAKTKLDALNRVATLLPLGGHVQVLDAEGFLQQTAQVDAQPGKKPWWYGPGLIFAACGIVSFAGGFTRLIMGASGPALWGSLLQAVGGAVLAVCGMLSHRHRRIAMTEAVRSLERQLSAQKSANDDPSTAGRVEPER